MNRHIHFTGACGRAIGSLAAELNHKPGWSVSASDQCQFAPMDQILKESGLEIFPDYKTSHVPKNSTALVIGSHITKDNVEVAYAEKKNIPIFNMAQFLQQYILKKGKRIVVAGTNGKTTTTTMLTQILASAGLQPDYLIGGNSPSLGSAVRFRDSHWIVLEGDEYIAGRNDPQPKFLYYKPDILILTNLSYDHAEIFTDLDSITGHFEKLISLLPENGTLIIPYGDQRIHHISKLSKAEIITVGQDQRADYTITQIRSSNHGTSFRLNGQKLQLSALGAMNIINASMAIAAAAKAKIDIAQAATALGKFRNATGRLEILADTKQGTYILDEGYHPDAIRENIAALRLRFPKRHLTVALLPRFTGGNDGYQMHDLPAVLAAADRVILAGVFDPSPFPGHPFSNRKLAYRIKRHGTATHTLKAVASLPQFLKKNWIPRDVVLCSIPPGHSFIYAPTVEWLRSNE